MEDGSEEMMMMMIKRRRGRRERCLRQRGEARGDGGARGRPRHHRGHHGLVQCLTMTHEGTQMGSARLF